MCNAECYVVKFGFTLKSHFVLFAFDSVHEKTNYVGSP